MLEKTPTIRGGFIFVLVNVTLIYLFSLLPPPNYITTSIEGPINFLSVLPAVVALDLATSKDTVVININSPGGDVNAGFTVIKAMKQSKARDVIVSVGSFAASMAAEIAQEAPVVAVTPESLVLIHTVSITDPITGQSIKILPYVLNTQVLLQNPLEAMILMSMAKDLYIMTALNSYGLWSPQSVIDVAAGEDVTDMAGGYIWERTDPIFNNENRDFAGIIAIYGLDVHSDSSYDDVFTGLLFNKMITLTYHPMFENLGDL